MKSVKFFGLCAVTLLLSVFASCTGNVSEDYSSEPKYGSITINSGATSRFLDATTISKASVTVEGYGMTKVSSKADVEINSGKGTAIVHGIEIGKNRVVTVIAKDADGNAIDGVEMRAVVPEIVQGVQDVTVNWSTTALGNLYHELLALDYDITELPAATAKTYLPDANAALIDTAKLAADIKAGKTPAASDYLIEGRKITFTVDHESDDVTVYVNDRSSKKLTSVVKGVNTLTGIAPGKWDMTFLFKSTQILGSYEVDVTDADFTVADTIKLTVAKPRLEDANGNALDLSAPVAAQTVYLRARSYEDEKLSSDIAIYYTLDGTEPTASSVKYNDANGISVTKNTTIKAFATLAPFFDSEIVTLEPKVRCSTPKVVKENGDEYTDDELNFTSVTTVYLKADTGAEIKYYVDDSTTPAAYDSTKGITLSTSQTIKAVASLDGYEDSLEKTFGFNVTLPIGTLTISGTTSSARRFKGENTITISSDSGIDGITIIYTKDEDTTPGRNRDGSLKDNCALYEGPFVITEDTVIKAMAYKDGWKDSEIAGPVSFVRATKLSTPVINGTTNFVDSTDVTISYTGSESGVKIYYTTDENLTTAAAIIANGTEYTDSFTIDRTCEIKTVATLDEDYIDSDISSQTFVLTYKLLNLTFTKTDSISIDYSTYIPYVHFWTEGEKASSWTKAGVNTSTGVISFQMPSSKQAFMVVLVKEKTTKPDWYAINDDAGRIYYQTNANGISYIEGTSAYTGEFKSYEPSNIVKIPYISVVGSTVTITSETESSTIYYTTDGTNPVDSNGSPLVTASKYTEPFTISSSVEVIKAAAIRDSLTTSDVKIYMTKSNELTVTWYVGVPATFELPNPSDVTTNNTITTTGMKIAFNGNGFAWKEFEMTECTNTNSSNSSVKWYKISEHFNCLDGSSESLITFQPRIAIDGQGSKSVLYYHPIDGNGNLQAGINANTELANKYVVIDGTDRSKWAIYTSIDANEGGTNQYTQDWGTSNAVVYTDTDPSYN